MLFRSAWKAGGLLRDVERERGFAHSSQVVTNDTPYQDILKAANLDRMTAHRDAEKRCHRLLRLSWKRSTVRVWRFWLLRLLALGFLGLRPFLCIRLGRRLGLREARGTVPLALERWYDFHSLGKIGRAHV